MGGNSIEFSLRPWLYSQHQEPKEHVHLHFWTSLITCSTVDRENFAVKIISRSRPTAKIKHAKNKLRGDDQ